MSAAGAKKLPRGLAAQPRRPAGVSRETVTPAVVNLTAADPDLPGGSTPATVSFRLNGAHTGNNWTLSVSGASTNCAGSLSGITVACTGGSGTCASGAATLTGSPQQIAVGPQSQGTEYYSVDILISFNDSWSYVAQQTPPCDFSITYYIDAP